MSNRSPASTRVSTVLNTIEHERHARGALIAAFADDLRAAIVDNIARAPESTRSLAAIAKAERGEIDEEDFEGLLTDLRTLATEAA